MKSVKLYAFTIPLMLWPIMDFSISEIPDYIKGFEFRQFLAAIVSELLAGVTDAAIISAVQATFGVTIS